MTPPRPPARTKKGLLGRRGTRTCRERLHRRTPGRGLSQGRSDLNSVCQSTARDAVPAAGSPLSVRGFGTPDSTSANSRYLEPSPRSVASGSSAESGSSPLGGASTSATGEAFCAASRDSGSRPEPRSTAVLIKATTATGIPMNTASTCHQLMPAPQCRRLAAPNGSSCHRPTVAAAGPISTRTHPAPATPTYYYA